MSSSTPPWVSPELAPLIARRGLMPGVERLQTLYVTYHESGQEARVSGWELAHSCAKGTGEGQLDTVSQVLPAAISMKLVEAPAEFCVPVKQDRRLAPAFKVRVEVTMGTARVVPVAVTAHLITQKQKDNILIWSPDDEDDKQAKAYTELKGNTCLRCTFAADPVLGMEFSHGGATAAGSTQLSASSQLPERLTLASALMNMAPRRPTYPPSSFASGLIHHHGGPAPLDIPPMPQPPQTMGSNNSVQGQQPFTVASSSSDALEATGLVMLGTQPSAAGGSRAWNDSNLDNLMSSMTMGGHVKLEDNNTLAGHAAANAPHDNTNSSSLPKLSPPSNHTLDASGAGSGTLHQFMAARQQQAASALEASKGAKMTHDLEFTGLEFLKPTRMNKVYMVFVCHVGQDMLTLVYHIPTIGICRAEQRIKALQKLSLPLELLPQAAESAGGVSGMLHQQQQQQQEPVASGHMDIECRISNGSGLQGAGEGSSSPLPTVSGKRRSSQLWVQEVEQRAALMHSHQSHTAAMQSSAHKLSVSGTLPVLSSGTEMHPLSSPAGGDPSQVHPPTSHSGTLPVLDSSMTQFGMMHVAVPGALGAAPLAGVYHEGQLLMTRTAMRNSIQEEYDSAGFSRRLTEQDMQALLCQAGLPPDEPAAVSLSQWTEFQDQWRAIMTLIRYIGGLWNMTAPYIISGLDMDRRGTVQALANEPVGTFVIRFSLSQPGSLVLSCKVYAAAGQGDPDNLVHAMITLRDLDSQRIEAWIMGLPQATHILDVYRQRRFDKTQVFGVKPVLPAPQPPPAASSPALYMPVSTLMQQAADMGMPQPQQLDHSKPPAAFLANQHDMGAERYPFQSPFLNHHHVRQEIQFQLKQQIEQQLRAQQVPYS